MKENLGKQATDKVSGYKGTITSVVFYLNGCTQYGIAGKVSKDNKIPDVEYFDSQQVEVDSDALKIKRRNTGGLQRDCPKY